MIWDLLGTLYSVIELINLVFILVVLLSGKNPARILSWLLVLYFLPMLGFLLYLFFVCCLFIFIQNKQDRKS